MRLVVLRRLWYNRFRIRILKIFWDLIGLIHRISGILILEKLVFYQMMVSKQSKTSIPLNLKNPTNPNSKKQSY
jgi:hypothetical protein